MFFLMSISFSCKTVSLSSHRAEDSDHLQAWCSVIINWADWRQHLSWQKWMLSGETIKQCIMFPCQSVAPDGGVRSVPLLPARTKLVDTLTEQPRSTTYPVTEWQHFRSPCWSCLSVFYKSDDVVRSGCCRLCSLTCVRRGWYSGITRDGVDFSLFIPCPQISAGGNRHVCIKIPLSMTYRGGISVFLLPYLKCWLDVSSPYLFTCVFWLKSPCWMLQV